MRDMNVTVLATDERRIEVLAQDLPCFGGSQLAIDVTLRSALGRTGEAQPNAAATDGAVLTQARVDKETKYYSPGNQFERFRGFLELIRRFEFDFRRRENYFFSTIRIFGAFM